MVTRIWVNIGLGNGLLPDGTKPLPEPMLTYHQKGPFEDNFTSDTSAINHWNKLENYFTKFHWNLPGVNELTESSLSNIKPSAKLLTFRHSDFKIQTSTKFKLEYNIVFKKKRAFANVCKILSIVSRGLIQYKDAYQ